MHRLLTSLIISLLCSFSTNAQPQCDTEDSCIEIRKWDLGIAIGYGEKSNPLKDFDNIPIYLAPSIAYYGEKWFFDNGNLGYTLAEAENYTVNLTTSYSNDSAYFNRWDPTNIFIAQNSRAFDADTGGAALAVFSEPDFNPDELANRNFTYLGGIESFIYTRFGIVKLAVAHDLVNVHQGTEAEVKWTYNYAIKNWQIEAALVFHWKSEEVVDYYYGIRPHESLYWSEQYRASSAWNQGLELTSRYAFTEHWDILMLARYTKLADEITASPLLDEGNSSTYFVGAAYRF